MKKYAFLKIIVVSTMIMLVHGLVPVYTKAQVAPDPVTLPLVEGKDIRFTALTSEDGLSSGNVFGIAQDIQGFLWFATGDGLSRYDGYSFRIYRFDHDNANSLSNNSMVAVCKGRGGILWLATTGGGVNRFDPATETFTHYLHEPDNQNTLSGNHISKYGLYEDRQGILWIGTVDNGLDQFNPVTGTFTHYRHDPHNTNSLSSNNIESINQDSGGMIWIGTSDAGLNQLDPVSGQITRYLTNTNVHGTYEDRTGTFWVGTEKGFGTLDRSTGSFTRYTISSGLKDAVSLNAIMRFHEDAAGNLWLGTAGAGVLKFVRQQKRVLQYKNDPANPHSLRNNFISSFWEDPSGTLWVGTMGGGVNRFLIRPPKFVHYKHEADIAKSVADNFILSIFEDHAGIVWIGNDRVLNRWDRRSNTWQFYRNDPANPTSISNGSVTATQEDPDGTIWFGTFFGGLNRFNPGTGQFKAYRFNANDPHSLGDDIIRSLYIDSKGELWVGGWNNGMSHFDRATETFQRYGPDPGNPSSLSGGSVTDIYEDRGHTLWVATEGGGLNQFDEVTGMFRRFQNDPHNMASLPSNAVRVLYEDRNGQFWVGTTGGLCTFDRASGTCMVYTEKEGLPNNTIEGILEDEQGNLWISTNNGLACFNPMTKNFRNYDVMDGLQSNEFNSFTAFYKSPHTGEMYFGGINGFNIFDPNQVKDNPFIPPIVLTDFRLFSKSVTIGGKSVLQKNINETNDLVLPYNQNSITFEFSALSYVAPAKNQYRYKLEGFDADWHNVGSKERLAVYTNLSAGEYIFRVQGTNEDRVWNKKGKAIHITIILPWWQTWWFLSIMTLLLVVLFIAGFSLRLKNIRKRGQEFERLVVERTAQLQAANKELEAFAYSVSHDLRTPLRGIDGFSQILLDEFQDKVDEQGKTYLHRIRSAAQHMAQLIDDMLNLSRVNRAEMTIQQVNLSEMAQEVADELHDAQPERETMFIIQEGINAQGDGHLLRIVLENLIGNAWKFTSKKTAARIEFGMMLQNETPVLFVRDNGAGFNMEYIQKLFGAFQRLHTIDEFPGTGIGLATVQRIIHRHGGKVWAEGELEKGATFYFTLSY